VLILVGLWRNLNFQVVVKERTMKRLETPSKRLKPVPHESSAKVNIFGLEFMVSVCQDAKSIGLGEWTIWKPCRAPAEVAGLRVEPGDPSRSKNKGVTTSR
jgi:hypothetical protein